MANRFTNGRPKIPMRNIFEKKQQWVNYWE